VKSTCEHGSDIRFTFKSNYLNEVVNQMWADRRLVAQFQETRLME